MKSCTSAKSERSHDGRHSVKCDARPVRAHAVSLGRRRYGHSQNCDRSQSQSRECMKPRDTHMHPRDYFRTLASSRGCDIFRK